MNSLYTRCAIALATLFLYSVADAADIPNTGPTTEVPPTADAILIDPDIHLGVLPNGLRFAIMRNATPKSALSLRLAINVGEFDEEEGERGAAHFVEHLAFSGGENAHEAGLESKFADAGVEFGHDQNAFTTTFSTTYKLDLPDANPGSVELGFGWLRKVADGTTFSEAAIKREREVILAERDVRLGPELLAQEDSERFLTPGLRSTRPESIGSRAQLLGLNGVVLQNFYYHWYRPENTVVTIVGDEPEGILEQKIRDTFGNWQGRGPKSIRPQLRDPDMRRGLEIHTRAESRLSAALSLCRISTADVHGIDDVIRLRRSLLTKLWTGILNRRLAALTKPDDAPFFESVAISSQASRESKQTCIVTIPLLNAWARALRVSASELRRFTEQGPTRQEVDDAIDIERAGLRGGMRTAATRISSGLADSILDKLLVGDVAASPTEAFRAFDVAVEDVSPQDVLGAFANDWSGAGPLITVSTADLVSPDAVRQVWSESQRVSIDQTPTSQNTVSWPYTDFGKNGRVTKREAFSSPEFTRLTYENGVVLNFKQTEFERDQVKIRLRFGSGRREIPSSQRTAALLGSQFFPYMGLGQTDIRDLQRLFAQMEWDATLQVRDDAFVLKGATSQRDLKTQLQILAALVSDPGFRSSFNARLPTLIDYYFRNYRSDPETVLHFALLAATDGNPSHGLPSKGQLLKLQTSDFAQLLKPALLEAPLEVTIVGDVDEAAATEYVAETFGSLRSRKSGSRERADTAFLRFPDRAIPLVQATHEGPKNVAVIGVDWPLYVAVPERRREEVSLMLLQKVFDNKLRHRVRQELGRSYAPVVQMLTPDNGDQGYMQAIVETSPKDADLVRAEIRAMATGLAKGEISDLEIEAARKPLIANFSALQQTNDWWVGGLDGSAREPARLEEMKAMIPLIAGVTLQEVRQVAATWLTRVPIEIVVLPTSSQD